MRLRKSKDGWHASGVLVRDERSEKTSDEPTKPAGAKKKTKKWCKGKVGKEHEPVCVAYDRHHNHTPLTGSSTPAWRILVCKKCRKHLDYWFPMKGFRERPKPEWVK